MRWREWLHEVSYHRKSLTEAINQSFFISSDYRTTNGYERAMDMDDEGDDSQNVPSDIDSQVSFIVAEGSYQL